MASTREPTAPSTTDTKPEIKFAATATLYAKRKLHEEYRRRHFHARRSRKVRGRVAVSRNLECKDNVLYLPNLLFGRVSRAGEVDGVHNVEREGERPRGVDAIRLRAPADRVGWENETP